MTTGKTIALAIWTFIGKVMFLLFYTMSRFVNTFLLKKQLSSDFMAAVTVWSDFWSPRGNLSLQFSRSVMSDSLQPKGLEHAWLPCPSPTPGVCSNSCPLSRWCHPTISSSIILFSSCLQCFWTSRSFQMSQFFASDGQNIGVSALTSVLPMNTQDWSPLGWTGWISL